MPKRIYALNAKERKIMQVVWLEWLDSLDPESITNRKSQNEFMERCADKYDIYKIVDKISAGSYWTCYPLSFDPPTWEISINQGGTKTTRKIDQQTAPGFFSAGNVGDMAAAAGIPAKTFFLSDKEAFLFKAFKALRDGKPAPNKAELMRVIMTAEGGGLISASREGYQRNVLGKPGTYEGNKSQIRFLEKKLNGNAPEEALLKAGSATAHKLFTLAATKAHNEKNKTVTFTLSEIMRLFNLKDRVSARKQVEDAIEVILATQVRIQATDKSWTAWYNLLSSGIVYAPRRGIEARMRISFTDEMFAGIQNTHACMPYYSSALFSLPAKDDKAYQLGTLLRERNHMNHGKAGNVGHKVTVSSALKRCGINPEDIQPKYHQRSVVKPLCNALNALVRCNELEAYRFEARNPRRTIDPTTADRDAFLNAIIEYSFVTEPQYPTGGEIRIRGKGAGSSTNTRKKQKGGTD